MSTNRDNGFSFLLATVYCLLIFMPFDWSQKVVFITGASSGIGQAVAIELVRRGASLGLLARRAEALQQIVVKVEEAGGRAVALPADVKDAEAGRAAAAQLRDR